jgi:hypothetical protein
MAHRLREGSHADPRFAADQRETTPSRKGSEKVLAQNGNLALAPDEGWGRAVRG